jgi:predicted ATPase
MKLTRLLVKDIKSLREVNLDEIGQLNIFVGRNNSGKSAIFQALKLLRRDSGMFLSPPITMIHHFVPYGTWKIEVELEPSEKVKNDIMPWEIQKGENLPGKNRYHEFINGNLIKKVKYSIEKGVNPSYPRQLNKLEVWTEEEKWVTLHEEYTDTSMSGQVLTGGYSADLKEYLAPNQFGDESIIETTKDFIERKKEDSRFEDVYNPNSETLGTALLKTSPFVSSILRAIQYCFDSAFFFDPQRQSQPRQAVVENPKLSSRGDNLAQVLATLNLNNKNVFEKIENFIVEALPDLGILQTSLYGTDTAVEFQPPNMRIATEPSILRNYPEMGQPYRSYKLPLHSMGGGVEQLVMIAVALNTTSEAPLFIEEPETYLHPAAQRYLLEKLSESGRQVFITTHSPAFVNSQYSDRRVYRVEKDKDESRITPVLNPDEFSAVLREIGARNSDVLLADAVLFVEGVSDEAILETWASILKDSLTSKGVAVLSLGGTSNFNSAGVVRSETLEKISSGAPLPHLFLIDHDHRSAQEVENLSEKLGTKLHILERREIENYLLEPRAILAALKKHNGVDKELLKETTIETIKFYIDEAVEALYNTVLIKRIAVALGRPRNGFLSRERIDSLIELNSIEDLGNNVWSEVLSHLDEHVNERKAKEIVEGQKTLLDKDWEENKLEIVPGKDVLAKVFEKFNVKYKNNETVNGKRIAQEMQSGEIPKEIKEIIKKVKLLVEPENPIA